MACASQIGQTPLHAAAGSNRLACAQALMQRGADVNAKSNVRRNTRLVCAYCCLF
jgi:ankyrin repeat protein